MGTRKASGFQHPASAGAAHIEAVQSVMQQFTEWLQTLDSHSQDVLSNALLNVTVTRISQEIAPRETAGLLWRLADAVSNATSGTPAGPIDLRPRMN